MASEKRHSRPTASATKRSHPAGLPLWKKALFASVACIGFFVAIELALLACGVRPVLYDEDPYVGFSSYIPLFVEEKRPDGTAVLKTARNKIKAFNAQEFPPQKPSGTYRIFCMGGSTTYGRPYNDVTSFCGWLREFLPVADNSKKWEVVNAGGISYASYRVAMLMEELIRYEPNLFIIYSGQNEFLERRTYSDIIEMPDAVRGLGAILNRSRTYAALREMVRGGSQRETDPEESEEVLQAEVEALLDNSIGPKDYTRDDALKEQVLAHYRFNLARMVDIALSAGAEVIFVTPAVNLRSSTPFKSQHRDDLKELERKKWQELYQVAEEAYADARFDAALRQIDAAMLIDDRYAHAHYLRGQVLDALTRFADAKSAYLRASDEDVCPLRALSSMPDIVRQVGAERSALVVDFVSVVDGASEHGIPGDNLFLDHVHPTIEGNRRLAIELLNAMIATGIVRPSASWNEAAIERVTERVEGGLDAAAHGVALKNLAKVLGWAGKFEESRKLGLRAAEMVPDDPEAEFTLGVVFERQGKLEEAKTHYERSISLAPDDPVSHHNLGRVAMKMGDLDAARAGFEKAISLRPNYAEALANLGNLLSRQGDLTGAVRFLQKAVDLDPDNSELQQKIGALLLKQGQLAAAASHLRAALRLRPDFALAHNNLGTVLLELEKPEEALTHYQEALQIEPDYASAHNNLGNLRANQGQIAVALVHFGEVLRIEPEHAEMPRKLESMAASFRQAGARRPDDPRFPYYLGLVAAARGESTEAATLFREALRLARTRGDAKLAREIEKSLKETSSSLLDS